jgi:hypothetical protein
MKKMWKCSTIIVMVFFMLVMAMVTGCSDDGEDQIKQQQEQLKQLSAQQEQLQQQNIVLQQQAQQLAQVPQATGQYQQPSQPVIVQAPAQQAAPDNSFQDMALGGALGYLAGSSSNNNSGSNYNHPGYSGYQKPIVNKTIINKTYIVKPNRPATIKQTAPTSAPRPSNFSSRYSFASSSRSSSPSRSRR